MTDPRTQTINRALLLAWLGVMLLLTLTPVPGRGQRLNLRPGADLTNGLSMLNLIGNMLLFTPMGALAATLRAKLGAWWRLLLAATALSLAVECAQWFGEVGRAADANDVLGNAGGALTGYLAVAAVARRRRRSATSVETPVGELPGSRV